MNLSIPNFLRLGRKLGRALVDSKQVLDRYPPRQLRVATGINSSPDSRRGRHVGCVDCNELVCQFVVPVGKKKTYG